MSGKRRYMHGKRRRRSPLKGIWDTKETTPSIVKSEKAVKTDTENYQKTQKGNTGKNKKVTDAIVNTIVPESGTEALTMIAGGGLVKAAKNVGKGYQTIKAAKTIKSGAGD